MTLMPVSFVKLVEHLRVDVVGPVVDVDDALLRERGVAGEGRKGGEGREGGAQHRRISVLSVAPEAGIPAGQDNPGRAGGRCINGEASPPCSALCASISSLASARILAALPGAHPLPPGDAEPGAVIAAARAAGRAAALAFIGKADAPARRLDRELADLVADTGRAAIHQRSALGPGDAGQLAHVAVEEIERDVEIGRTLVEPHELQHIGRRVLRSG